MSFPDLNPVSLKKRISTYVTAFFLLSIMFVCGFVTVYKNCYNSMNEEPMTVFDVSTANGKTEVTILNRIYHLN